MPEHFQDFNSILDCCNPKNDGSNEYKGKYTFPKALAGSNNSQTCKYGGSSNTSSDAVVNCEPNMETGPTYGLLNVTLCPAKYQTTDDLEKLNQVELCCFVSKKNCKHYLIHGCLRILEISNFEPECDLEELDLMITKS